MSIALGNSPGQWAPLTQDNQKGTTESTFNLANVPQSWANAIGFNGPVMTTNVDHEQEVNPAFLQYMQANGIDPRRMYDTATNNYTVQGIQNGQLTGDPLTYKNTDDKAFMYAALAAGAIAGGGIAAAGAGGAGTGAATAAGATGTGAASGTGALGYGVGYVAPSAGQFAGMTVAQLDAAAAGLGGAAGAAGGAGGAAASSPGAAAPAATGTTGATTAAGGAGTALTGGAGTTAGATAAGGSLLSGVSNGQLLSTAGGLLGAAVGGSKAGSSLNSATNTSQNQVDPRLAQYVYGQDGNSGLLGNVNNIMNSQLATGGLNATQTQGLNMQLSALQDPAYGASLQQMRNVGTGLLGGSQAGNPFTAGATGAPTTQSAPAPQTQPPGWAPLQTQLNQPQRPQMSGLLNPTRQMAY